MAVCISKLNKKITIQRMVGATADAHGHVPETTGSNWATYCNSYASVTSRGGREFWKVQQTNADVSHVWMCPYSKALAEATPDMRLVCEDVTYNIISVIDIDLKHEDVEIQTKRAV